jgi:hypothetical protein
MNLAALRYRNVLATAGGPVARVQLSDAVVLESREFLANAYLTPGLIPVMKPGSVYSCAHGSGTAGSPMVARFIAISEAMERWAHAAVSGGSNYGFAVDPSSNGMAAFPGLFAREARTNALLEAAERFNLLNWWEGRLPALESSTRWPEVRSVTICSEAPGITIILFRPTAAGFIAYGHAAAMDANVACRKAAVEMERHAQVVTRFAVAHSGEIRHQLPVEANVVERRSLFFALPEGHELFLGRLRSRTTQSAPQPKVMFDGVIPGPWSRYADVWRVAYAPPSERFLCPDENYFFW